MPVRLYLDNDSLDWYVTNPLRAEGVDILTTPEAGNHLAPDDIQLAFATSQGRAIYTANTSDYARLHSQWMREGRSHAGIIVRVRQQLSVGEQIRALLAVCGEFESSGLTDRLIFLENWL